MSDAPDRRVNALGVRCPEAVGMVRDAIGEMRPGQVLEVVADDPVIFLDLPDWCSSRHHLVMSMEQRRDVITTLIRVA